ncbi:aspartate kinase [Mucilaginibacter arboris]|uniref:Aspartokinase n=1 Tax=Mucilaginibacter arboris TaxID=2682090 RepID=A0A7K1SYX8_9SPHI|nr:aspartate kinase [Mucilaginibacter arboris]MVN22467.1 aspartate kinase [Mucilaginibacter arboris]
MQVFKFGGASVKDAAAIKNLAEIVRQYQEDELLIVVSAMGKMTNALEQLTTAYINQTAEVQTIFAGIRAYHDQILTELFDPSHPIFDEVENTFVEIEWMIEEEPHDDPNFIYDQIVSIGELVSSRIVTAYLNQTGIKSKWLDVRGYIQTDNTYREGLVDWQKTSESIKESIPSFLQKEKVVTQGFIGGTSENFTTTLGREGSDYTAAIFASCLNAASVTIWKDVAGVFNADPKRFQNIIKFDQLSYPEAVEMAYYGASIIHPKTIQPLQNAGIPLFVKPFLTPQDNGTVILGEELPVKVPVIIVKTNQVLVSVSSKNHSFITENHLSEIYKILAELHFKVNLMQNSALSFSFCVDFESGKFEQLMQKLKQDFNFKYNTGTDLITVRHYEISLLRELSAGKTILLEQLSRNTAQILIKAEN